MKNILIITHYFPPESVGRASRIFEIAKFLNKNHNVTVIAPPPTYPFKKFKKNNSFFSKEKQEGLQVLRIWTYQPQKDKPTLFQRAMYYLFFPFFTSWFLLVKSRKISTIIISTPPSSALLVCGTARLLRKKLIIDVGDLWDTVGGFEQKYSRLRKLMKNFEINCWKKSDIITSNNHGIYERIKKILGEKMASKVNYLPYHVDVSDFKKQNTTVQRQLAYVGNFGFFYNFESMIKAFQIILKKVPDLRLEFYGGGDQEVQIKELVDELHLQENCRFNDPVPREQIPMILSKSIAGLIPLVTDDSGRHIFPTKTFEYLACGLPVFAFGPKGDLQNFLEKTKTGIFLNSNDPKKIADEMIKMLENKTTLEDFSKNGINFVKNNSGYDNLEKLI